MPFTVKSALLKLARYNGEQGSAWNATSNLQRLNDARRLIYEAGDYEGTMEYGCVKIRDCECIYLPAHLETPRIGWISNHPILIQHQNYMALDAIGRKSCYQCSQQTERAVQLTGVRRPIISTPDCPFSIQVEYDDPEEDVDCAKIHFFGYDHHGDKIEVTLDPENLTGGDVIRDLKRVTKPKTKGKVVVWAVDAHDNKTYLATYGADEVNPRFTQARILNYRTGDCERDLVVYAKKALREYDGTDLNEPVDIESMSALKFASQAINAQEGNRDDEYAKKYGLMEGHLNQADQNLSISDGAVPGNVDYRTAGSPDCDDGSIL